MGIGWQNATHNLMNGAKWKPHKHHCGKMKTCQKITHLRLDRSVCLLKCSFSITITSDLGEPRNERERARLSGRLLSIFAFRCRGFGQVMSVISLTKQHYRCKLRCVYCGKRNKIKRRPQNCSWQQEYVNLWGFLLIHHSPVKSQLVPQVTCQRLSAPETISHPWFIFNARY